MPKPQTNDRTVPHNLEAERALLGSIMLDKAALDFAFGAGGIDGEDMYSEAHKLILQRMVDLAEAQRTIDLVTLSEELARSGLLEKAGGAAYLSALSDGVPIGTTAAVGEYCRIIKEKSMMRRILNLANNVTARVIEGNDESEELIELAQTELYRLAEQKILGGFVPIRNAIKTGFAQMDTVLSGRDFEDGVKTGFTDLDCVMRRLRNSEMIVVGARPSVGKTAIALNIMAHVAIRGEKKAVGLFSLEMANIQLFWRMIASEGSIDIHRLMSGLASRDEIARIIEVSSRLAQAPIYIDDQTEHSVNQMRAKARRLKSETNLGLIVVDYVQLIAGNGENRTQEVSYVSRNLKAMAKELNIPVLAIAQLRRTDDQRRNEKPRLSDLRESGSIEQDADVVLLMYRCRDKDAEEDEYSESRNVRVIVAKNRNGPIGEFDLVYLSKWTRFENKAMRTDWENEPREQSMFDRPSQGGIQDGANGKE